MSSCRSLRTGGGLLENTSSQEAWPVLTSQILRYRPYSTEAAITPHKRYLMEKKVMLVSPPLGHPRAIGGGFASLVWACTTVAGIDQPQAQHTVTAPGASMVAGFRPHAALEQASSATVPTSARRPGPQPRLPEEAGSEIPRQGVCPRHECPQLLLLRHPRLVTPPGLAFHHEFSADYPHRPQLADQLYRPRPRGGQRPPGVPAHLPHCPALFPHRLGLGPDLHTPGPDRPARGNSVPVPRLTPEHVQPVPRRLLVHRPCPPTPCAHHGMPSYHYNSQGYPSYSKSN